MPGTRTAGTVDGTPTFTDITLRFIDYTGDLKAVTLRSDLDTLTDAEIESYAAAVVLASNASLYEIQKKQIYYSQRQASNALEEVYEDVSTNIVILYKDASANSQNMFVPAPLDTNLVDTTSNPDPSTTPLSLVITEAIEILDGGAAGAGAWTGIQARLTHRLARNQAVEV